MYLGGIAVSLSLIVGQGYPENHSRTLLHQEAAALLSATQFFHQGRGMTLSPDFVQTYELLAWIFNLSRPIPDEVSLTKRALLPFQSRWGIIDNGDQLQGFFNIKYKGMQIGAIGCVACHSGKAAGIFIPGLGNKNIDPGQIGRDGVRALKLWKAVNFFSKKSDEYRQIEDLSLDFNARLSNPQNNNLTQGMVPVAVIQEWFYKQAEKDLPSHHGRGQVKVPHFWGYSEKRFVGQFSDGFGNGEKPGWGLLVELVGGQSVAGAKDLMPKVEHIEDRIGDLLPPPYPFAIDTQASLRGQALFKNNCSGCHGTYERDLEGFPIYQAPKHIPWRVVKTDSDRLDIITEEFLDLVEKNPLSEYIQIHRREPGYFAPRLEGIWSRFPYLHNASIPHIRALLSHPGERPRRWSLKGVSERERFDEVNLGLKVDDDLKPTKARDVYDVDRLGHGNGGHWFSFSEALTEEDKTSLIEYLKSL